MGGNLEMIERIIWNDGAKKAAELAARKAVPEVTAVAEKAQDRLATAASRDVRAFSPRAMKEAAPKLLIDGKEAFSAFEKTLSGAKQRILLETFTFKNDETGKRIGDLLVQKARQGLDVRVLLDTYGTSTNLPEAPYLDFYKKMRDAGVDVRLHDPEVFSLKKGMPITHRKLLIVDGQKFLTGGMNISDRYAKEWHDTMIQMEGKPAQDATAAFNNNWVRAGGTPVPLATGSAFKDAATHPASAKVGSGATRVVYNDPEAGTYELTSTVMDMLDGAKHHIRVMMPYLSDSDFIASLEKAASRGVKVDVILPRLNDEKVYADLNEDVAQGLLEHGVRVRWYSGKPSADLPAEHFSHTKAIMVDSNTLFVGSANADHRALAGNHELSVVVHDPATNQDARRRLWGPDWAASKPADLAALQDASLSTRAKRWFWSAISSLI